MEIERNKIKKQNPCSSQIPDFRPKSQMSEESHSGSETDENSERSSSSEPENDNNGGSERASEYEKQRLDRIRENKARLEALRLPSLATKLYGSVEKKKGKQKRGDEDEDEEYKPGGAEERVSSSSGEESGQDQGSDGSAYSDSARKGKMRVSLNKSKSKKRISAPAQKHVRTVEYIDDDEALQKAIALSLGGSAEISGAVLPEPSQIRRTNVSDLQLKERKGRSMVLETDKRNKRRKANTSRVQITEDQVIIHFFQFDDMSQMNTGWQQETLVGSGTQKSQCKYCDEIIEGACMTRLMQHLAGSSSRGAACEHVPSHVQEEMKDHLFDKQISVSNETVRSVRQPMAVQPQEEDPEVRLQKDIEEAMRQSMNVQEEMSNHLFGNQISVSNENVRGVRQQQAVQPQEEEEDPEVRLQKDIEEAMRQSMNDPEYKEMEEIKIAKLESQRLGFHVLGGSSSKTPQSMVTIEDSDEELDRMLGFNNNNDDDDDDDDDILNF